MDSNSQFKSVSFGKATVWTVLIAVAMMGTAIVSKGAFAKLNFAPEVGGILAGFLAAAVAVGLTLFLEFRETHLSGAKALRVLGFKTGNCAQFKLAILGIVPIVIGYLVIFFGVGKSTALEPTAGLMIVKFIFSQGIGEEVVFRGFIFRHLRKGRSFWSAAGLSAVLFSLIHLVNFMKGTSPEIIMAIATSIVFGFILTFPLALLFEIGGYSILGAALFHLTVDSVNWFKEASEPGLPMNIYLGSILVAALVVVFMGLKIQAGTRESLCPRCHAKFS